MYSKNILLSAEHKQQRKDRKMNKILVVSHCILNPASKVVSYNQDEIKSEEAKRKQLLNYIMENDIRLIQLPCPEFYLYGAARWGHVKDQFNHSFYRKECRVLLEPVIDQLKEYLSYPDRFQVLSIVAIDGSPSCGYKLTCRGNWGGEFSGCPNFENKINDLTMTQESGVFMEELQGLLRQEEMDIAIKDLATVVEELDL